MAPVRTTDAGPRPRKEGSRRARCIRSPHKPKYQLASRRAPSSAPPANGNQECQQNQTKPVGRLGLQLQDQSLRVSQRPLCSCWPAGGFQAGKRQTLVFLSTAGHFETRFGKKKHQRTTPIESPEFLCNENCFNWCMAFHQLLPKIFPADNLSPNLLLHFLIGCL